MHVLKVRIFLSKTKGFELTFALTNNFSICHKCQEIIYMFQQDHQRLMHFPKVKLLLQIFIAYCDTVQLNDESPKFFISLGFQHFLILME